MKWTKPNGTEIETNDEPATVAHARSLGWTPEDEDGKEPDGAVTPADMKVDELRAALADADIAIPDGAKKADLVKLLEDAFEGGEEDEDGKE